MRQVYAKRQQVLDSLRKQRSELMRRIETEIGALRPIGRLSEWGEYFGYSGKRGVARYTPLGTFIFAKSRRPTDEQLRQWEAWYAETEQLSKRESFIKVASIISGPGQTVGGVKDLDLLNAEGLLSESEQAYLERLREFWRDNPDAWAGVVQKDGTITRIEK